MAKKYPTWPTTVQCDNGHTNIDDIEWVDMRVEESAQHDWRPITSGVTCQDPNYPNCNAPVKVV